MNEGAQTPRDVILTDGTASLYRFRTDAPTNGRVVLLVPSLINRWYVLDLREGASVVQAFVDAGFRTYVLDWGVPNDEDRYLEWDAVLQRLSRMARRVRRDAGVDKIGLLGYCMGATLCGIHTALEPKTIEALVNLAGPIDFEHAGVLGKMTDPRWFDPNAIADAGNVPAEMMQSGFVSMRPTSQLGKWVSLADRIFDPERLEAFSALDRWASDNIAFPAGAYRTYITDLYQKNLLVQGEHYARAQKVELSKIKCPVLTISASTDHICPAPAALGLNRCVGSDDTESFVIDGGHIGAVVGSRAQRTLYPKLTTWFGEKLEERMI